MLVGGNMGLEKILNIRIKIYRIEMGMVIRVNIRDILGVQKIILRVRKDLKIGVERL